MENEFDKRTESNFKNVGILKTRHAELVSASHQ
jgi:hypothetical protein